MTRLIEKHSVSITLKWLCHSNAFHLLYLYCTFNKSVTKKKRDKSDKEKLEMRKKPWIKTELLLFLVTLYSGIINKYSSRIVYYKAKLYQVCLMFNMSILRLRGLKWAQEHLNDYSRDISITYVMVVPLPKVLPRGSSMTENSFESDSQMCWVSLLCLDVTMTLSATRKAE